MSFYIIEDDDGKLLTDYGDFDNTMIHARLYDEPLEPEIDADEYGGHVVELVEKPTPVVVSQEEADMLEKAKHNPTLRPSFMITEYSNSHKGNILGNDLEDRLMSAYVIGWTVAKPKRYVLPMEGTELPDGTVAYALLDHTEAWTVKGYAEEQSAITFGSTVTQANIDSAPAWVKAITPVEVTEDEQ